MNSHRGQVGLISNPSSGHNRDQFARIAARIDQCRSIHHIITHSQADIAPALQDMAARDISVLAINGGDGTIAAILGALLESKLFSRLPLIALLPGGTANMTAGDIGICGSLARATNRLCNWCDGERGSDQKTAQRALLRVVTDQARAAQFGMFLGAGAIIQGTEFAHREVHQRGLRNGFSVALTTLRTVWGVLRNDPEFNQHVTTHLSVDGAVPVQHDALILAISTLHRLAFGMRPFWGTGPGDLRLTLIEQGCSRFARTFFSIVRGKPNHNAVPDSGYFSHNADSIVIELNGKLNLDGEILEASGTVAISTSHSLEFLTL